jgi:hypothetical protein
MAVEPSDALYNKIRDFKRFERGQFARAAGALPVGFSAQREGGVPAMTRAVEGMFARPGQGSVDQLDLAKQKQSLIEKMAEWSDKSKDQKMDAVAKASAIIKGKGDPVVDRLKLFIDLITKGGAANAAAAGHFNSALASISGHRSSLQSKALDNAADAYQAALLPKASKVNVDSILNKYADRIRSAGSGGDPDLLSELAAEARMLNGPSRQMMIIGAAQLSGDYDSFMNELQEFGDVGGNADAATLAGDAAAAREGVGQALASMDPSGALGAADADMEGAIALSDANWTEVKNALKMGGVDMDMDKLKEKWSTFNQMVGDDPAKLTPEQQEEAVNKMLKDQMGLDPKADPVALQKFDDLLNSLDQADDKMPANLAEAKRRLIADPEFQAFMLNNKFTDPGVALRELRKRSNDKVHANKMQSLEQRRAQHIAQGTDQPEASNTTAAASGGLGEQAKMGSASSGGQAEKTELEQAVADAGVSADDAAGLPGATGKPGMEPGVKAAVTPTSNPTPADLAKVKTTVPMAAEKIRNALFRPANTVNMAEAKVREWMGGMKEKQGQKVADDRLSAVGGLVGGAEYPDPAQPQANPDGMYTPEEVAGLDRWRKTRGIINGVEEEDEQIKAAQKAIDEAMSR